LRILFLLHQLPEDPGSRTPWTSVRIAGALALAGHETRVLGTTATVRPCLSAYRLLEDAGFGPRVRPAKSGGRTRPELHYGHGSVDCRVVDVGISGIGEWESKWGRVFDLVLDREIQEFQPEVVVVPQGGTSDSKRHQRAKARGAKLFLSVAGTAHRTSADQSALYDAAICQSCSLAETWSRSTTLKPTVLPPPVPREEVVSDRREPVCVAFPSPTRDSGVFLLLRLAEQLSLADGDRPILVLTSAGAGATGHSLLDAGRMAGFDLGQYENILMADPTARPKDIWAAAQVFVAPALSNPPVTLIAEAMVNGIPPLVGDRVDLGDILGGAGFTLPLPLDYGPETGSPLSAAAVEEWVDAIGKLTSDEGFYAAESEKARIAAKAFDPRMLASRYAAFFEEVMAT
jgi:glycosyltransferase involved in cell wall biosynthesis